MVPEFPIQIVEGLGVKAILIAEPTVTLNVRVFVQVPKLVPVTV